MLGQFMEEEIEEQASILESNCNDYFRAAQALQSLEPFEMVLIAARGSSDNAALYLRYLIEIHLKIPVSLAAPSVLTRYGSKVKYPRCLGIGISQSGAAPDVSEILDSLRAAGHSTLAITNTEGSAVTRASSAQILLNAGLERSVAATKTYSASLLACYQLVRALGGDLPDPSNLLLQPEAIKIAKQRAEDDFGILNRSSVIFCLARGYSYCSAQETALKLMECALIPAKSYSTADFQHGPKALAGPGSLAISFGEELTNLTSQGCVTLNAPDPKLSEQLKPLEEIVYGQWLALFAARSRGLNPDNPKFIRKVTQTI